MSDVIKITTIYNIIKEDPTDKIIVVNEKKEEQKSEPELETLKSITKVFFFFFFFFFEI